MKIERSQSGKAALWEQGGGATNTGSARIICGPGGEPRRPLYIRRRGSLAGENHALVPISEGDMVVDADHHRRDFTIRVERITRIVGNDAETEAVATFERGEWSAQLPVGVSDAVDAARRKAICYHCREPHWIYQEE